MANCLSVWKYGSRRFENTAEKTIHEQRSNAIAQAARQNFPAVDFEVLDLFEEPVFDQEPEPGQAGQRHRDVVAVLANGASGIQPTPDAFAAQLMDVCRQLAKSIARDGEGASKFVELTVEGAPSDAVVM